MIRNRRFSRFNENRGLRRRYNEELSTEISLSDLKKAGRGAIKVIDMVPRYLEHIIKMYKNALKRYDNEYPDDRRKRLEYARIAADNTTRLLLDLNSKMAEIIKLAGRKYGIKPEATIEMDPDPVRHVEKSAEIIYDYVDPDGEFLFNAETAAGVNDNDDYSDEELMTLVIQDAYLLRSNIKSLKEGLFGIRDLIRSEYDED